MTTFRFDGAEIPFRRGQSVAAALLAAGVSAVRRTRGADAPRGVFCGIGVCFDCLATIDGAGGVRTCQVIATEGLEVTSAEPAASAPPPSESAALETVADLAIVAGDHRQRGGGGLHLGVGQPEMGESRGEPVGHVGAGSRAG